MLVFDMSFNEWSKLRHQQQFGHILCKQNKSLNLFLIFYRIDFFIFCSTFFSSTYYKYFVHKYQTPQESKEDFCVMHLSILPQIWNIILNSNLEITQINISDSISDYISDKYTYELKISFIFNWLITSMYIIQILSSQLILNIQMIITKQKQIIATYYISFFILGMTFNSLGPLIPFLSNKAGSPQSEFIYLTIIRGAIYLFTGLIDSMAFGKIKNHIKLFSCLAVIGLSLVGFAFTIDKIFLGVLFGFIAYSSCLLEILINSIILQIGRTDAKYWVSWLYAFYGIGAIVGPTIIGFLGIQGILLQAILSFSASWLYCFKCFRQDQLWAINSNTSNISQISVIKKTVSKKVQINLLISIVMCMSMLFIFRTFISTYAVTKISASPKEASFLVSLHFIAFTVTRLLITLLDWTSQRIIKLSSIIILISCCTFTIMAFTPYIYLTCLLSCTILGFTFSPLFPLILSLPATKGFIFSSMTMSNVLAVQAISQAIITSSACYLLSMTFPSMFFITLGVFGLLMIKYVNSMIKQMDQQLIKQSIAANNPQIMMTTLQSKKSYRAECERALDQSLLYFEKKKRSRKSWHDTSSRVNEQFIGKDELKQGNDLDRLSSYSNSKV